MEQWSLWYFSKAFFKKKWIDPNDQEAVEVSGLSVTTSPNTLTADYYTEGKLELGGEELVNHLLTIFD